MPPGQAAGRVAAMSATVGAWAISNPLSRIRAFGGNLAPVQHETCKLNVAKCSSSHEDKSRLLVETTLDKCGC